MARPNVRRDDAQPKPPVGYGSPQPPRPCDQQVQSPLDALENVAFADGDANVVPVAEVGEGIHRASPLGVAAQGVQGLLAAVIVGVSTYASMALDEDMREATGGLAFDVFLLASVGMALLVLAIVLVAAFVSWRTHTWELTPDALVLRSGVIVRNERRIPYQRVHSVDLSASVVERILGLVSLKIDTGASEAGSGNAIKSMPRDEAEALKRALFARRAFVEKGRVAQEGIPGGAFDVCTDETSAASGACDLDEPDVDYELHLSNRLHVLAALTDFSMGPAMVSLVAAAYALFEFAGKLFGAYLYSAADRAVQDIIGVASGRANLDIAALLPAALVAVLAAVVAVLLVTWVISAIAAYVRWGGFVVRRRRGRIEVSCGLLSRSTRAVDLHRVQSLSVSASPIRRSMGYVQVAVRTVGSADRGNEGPVRESVVVHPCISANEAGAFIAEVLPEFAAVVSVPASGLGLDRLPKAALRRTLLRGLYWTAACVVLVAVATRWAGAVCVGTPAAAAVVSAGMSLVWAVLAVGLAVMFVVRVLAWRIRAIGVWNNVLVAVDGGLARRVTYVVRPKVQSLTRRVTPFQARSGVATIATRTACVLPDGDPRMRDVGASTSANLMEWARPHYDNAQVAQQALREAGLAAC